MNYMRWFKTLPPSDIDIRISGAPIPEFSELDFDPGKLGLKVHVPYGEPELIEPIAKLYQLAPNQVLPIPGASAGLAIALAAAHATHKNPSRTATIESPVYDPIVRAAKLLNFDIIDLPRKPENGFQIDLQDLDRILGEQPFAVFVTNHHNPSAQYIDPESMRVIAEKCKQAGAYLIVDEVYLDAIHILKQQDRWTAAQLGDHVLAIGSLTKLYGFGGVRLGWVLASPPLIEASKMAFDALSVNNSVPTMIIATHILENLSKWEERLRSLYAPSRACVDAWIQHESRLTSYPDHGALYQLFRLPDGIGADDFAQQLATKQRVSIVPGTFFGLNDHFRVGLLSSPQNLEMGLAGVSRCLDQYCG